MVFGQVTVWDGSGEEDETLTQIDVESHTRDGMRRNRRTVGEGRRYRATR